MNTRGKSTEGGAAAAPEPIPPRAGPIELPGFGWRPVAGVAAGVVVLLLALAGRYGYHRDELYFLLAGRHLAWGYVDQPPLTPWLARLSELALGDSPLALRVLPALLAGVDVVLVALLAREFGGERRGQLLAAWATAGSAFVLATGHLLLTSSADLPASLGVLLLGLRLLRTGDGRWWLPLGAATGLALLNKDLVLLIGLALLAAVLVSGPRRALLSRWLPAGLALAVLVALPNLLWEAAHGWPQLTVANGITDKDGEQNRWLLLPLQLVLLSPAVVPLVLRGARRLRREPELSWARAYPLAYPLLLWLLSRFGGKAYYAVPLLLVLMAAGCAKPRGTGRVVTAGLLVGALVNVVITLPVLPPKALVAVGWIYPEAAEQVGWPQLASAAARGWAQIPPEQRDTAVLFAANYGEAGALARYGPGLGLPGPYSGHMSLADWGPPADRQAGPVLLVHPAGFGAVERQFTDCRPVGEVDTGQGVANQEQHAAVVLCAGPSRPWSQLWPQLRHYY